ncbi:MAG: peptidoglycan-binding domain-containing protein [Pseudomonadota bacterium]
MKKLLAALTLMFASPAMAADVAVMVSPFSVTQSATAPFFQARTALEQAGFVVERTAETDPARLANRFQAAFSEVGREDRVIVYIRGDIVISDGRAYLLNADSRARLNPFNIGLNALDLTPVLDALERFGPRALLLVSTDEPPRMLRNRRRAALFPAVGARDVSHVEGQGTNLMLGLAALANDRISVRDAFRGSEVRAAPSSSQAFLPPAPGGPGPREARAWGEAERIGTIAAYLAYMSDYPDGFYFSEALARISELREGPKAEPTPAELEAALNLNRNTRTRVQINLQILGFNPRGVDGIFGPGSRAAIREWQLSRGFQPTGFLSGNQVNALENQADVRRAEIAKEDEAFWQQSGALGGVASLQRYLDRYPNGIYADEARRLLAAIEEERLDDERRLERVAWQRARRANTAAAYRDFLRRYPDGFFATEARERLAALTAPTEPAGPTEQQIAQARAEEAQVLENPITRLLAERQLAALGFNPGSVDGRFTEGTRRALRAFQITRNIPATSYLGRPTAVALLNSVNNR